MHDTVEIARQKIINRCNFLNKKQNEQKTNTIFIMDIFNISINMFYYYQKIKND